jgi:hypothetical protein
VDKLIKAQVQLETRLFDLARQLRNRRDQWGENQYAFTVQFPD